MEPWPLSTSASSRLLCWPDYASACDFAVLAERLGGELARAKGVCLCLRFDPRADGSPESAIRAIEEFARGLGPEAQFEVLLVDDEMDAKDWPRLGAAVDALLALPSADAPGERRRFAQESACPLAASAQEAQRLLRAGPALRRFRRWRELTAATEGWFSPEAAATWDALLCFQERRRQSGWLGEIGVYMGKSASLLALHRDREQLLGLIDIDFPRDARALLDPLAPAERVSYLEERSSRLDGDPRVAGWMHRFRWFHIDGEHTGQALTNDLRLALRWLDDHGIACIDDFFSPMYPQLTQAVFRFVDAHPHELTPFLVGYNKCYLCRPLAAREYMEMIRTELVPALADRGHREITVFKTTEASDMNCFGMGARFQGFACRGPDWDPTRVP